MEYDSLPISHMKILGIDDRTKALFTEHSTLAVFARYMATNLDRARIALGRLADRVTGYDMNMKNISKNTVNS